MIMPSATVFVTCFPKTLFVTTIWGLVANDRQISSSRLVIFVQDKDQVLSNAMFLFSTTFFNPTQIGWFCCLSLACLLKSSKTSTNRGRIVSVLTTGMVSL